MKTANMEAAAEAIVTTLAETIKTMIAAGQDDLSVFRAAAEVLTRFGFKIGVARELVRVMVHRLFPKNTPYTEAQHQRRCDWIAANF